MGGALQCVATAFRLPACVCAWGKDMLLTLWLSFLQQIAFFLHNVELLDLFVIPAGFTDKCVWFSVF